MTIYARAEREGYPGSARGRVIDLINREFILKYKAEILLPGILVLSAFLNLWNIWNQGFTNTFYAAAVKSTLVNPAAGFFNSFDPAGFVTVDKPPVGLWVQAVFAAVLGFSGWVLVLPQALAGIGSVALIYFIVARPFGKPAGLVAALALAVTPILVAVSRNGTMDTQLIFVLLLAVWVAIRAARERSLPWLLVSVILIGIGFNIKMIQAFVVVPAVLVIYFLGTPDLMLRKRALHIGLAIIILIGVSLSWAVAVDMVPASERPYIGGSGDNTVLGLIVNYNGLERLGLESRGMAFIGDGAREQRTGTFREAGQRPQSSARAAGANPYGDLAAARGGAAGGMANGEGAPGITRFFGEQLAGQFSWLLPLALIGLLAWVRRPASLTLKGFEDAGIAGERGLTLIAMLLWLVPGLLFFSFTTAFGHTYYIATIAPPLAALVGIGAVAMYWEYLTEGWKGWLLVGAVLITGLLQALFLSYDAAWSGPPDPARPRWDYRVRRNSCIHKDTEKCGFTQPSEIHGGRRHRAPLCRPLRLVLHTPDVREQPGSSRPLRSTDSRGYGCGSRNGAGHGNGRFPAGPGRPGTPRGAGKRRLCIRQYFHDHAGYRWCFGCPAGKFPALPHYE